MDQTSGVKRQIMDYYNSVGWKNIQDGVFHNASREDLRPVAQEYIHRCRMRVKRHLPEKGEYLLDAGSGPIQYPEYLEYSRDYRYRVCLDISRLALVEARERIGDHGLMVLGDIAHLPFRKGAVDGVVSLHAVHHIPGEEQLQAFHEMWRVLKDSGAAVIVHSWGNLAPIQRVFRRPMKWIIRARRWISRLLSGQGMADQRAGEGQKAADIQIQSPTFRHDFNWVQKNLGSLPGFRLLIWRTINTKFSRVFIHRFFFGKLWLRLLYSLEEKAPVFFARYGQYPMIIYHGSTEPIDSGNEG
ncbi:MAG: class I SAM-dependent methyltransferase [Anaerolineales bacterium]|nr:class I SAM-dependent methyltransferase [Anaerolineales bacterium]